VHWDPIWTPLKSVADKASTPCFVFLCLISLSLLLNLPLTHVPLSPNNNIATNQHWAQKSYPNHIEQRWSKLQSALSPPLRNILESSSLEALYAIKGVIYTIVDLSDGGVYVGQTRYNVLKRFKKFPNTGGMPITQSC
jgi:hypothetical protein